jgi:hypothetical protein
MSETRRLKSEGRRPRFLELRTPNFARWLMFDTMFPPISPSRFSRSSRIAIAEACG